MKMNKKGIIKSGLAGNIFDYIVCDSENAYESRNKIKDEIVEKIKKTGLSKNDFVVLMAAGLSKTIIYDMSGDGYQILDIGKGLESYYFGTSVQHII